LTPPADVQTLIQQAVQPALAAQQPLSTSQAPATGTTPAATPSASATPADWCALHQVAMEQRSNAKGTWYSHWVVSEQRYCKGKHERPGRRRATALRCNLGRVWLWYNWPCFRFHWPTQRWAPRPSAARMCIAYQSI